MKPDRMEGYMDVSRLVEGLREIQAMGGPPALLATATLAHASPVTVRDPSGSGMVAVIGGSVGEAARLRSEVALLRRCLGRLFKAIPEGVELELDQDTARLAEEAAKSSDGA